MRGSSNSRGMTRRADDEHIQNRWDTVKATGADKSAPTGVENRTPARGVPTFPEVETSLIEYYGGLGSVVYVYVKRDPSLALRMTKEAAQDGKIIGITFG
jgi:hypothetical protein